ncbi:MAG: MBL fold metallo-hydrolase [Acidimicrobiia bacterium]|nr:MBL fold metallo-hydrolase [Acidimicrobiia bacterium]
MLDDRWQMVVPLAAGVDYTDLHFLGHDGIIATALIHGRDGVAIVDPGPTTAMPVLERALAVRGFGWGDVRAILLTHIHLDHAGATGSILQLAPKATVYVHERGAAHLIDPSKLLASASRLYAPDMEKLWGDVLPVPAPHVRTLGESDRLTIAGHNIDVAWTPGHAWHHVSYFLPASGIAFVGDTAGICRPSGRLIIPPTPPPDIDLDAWRSSTGTILAWNPATLFLTHFGPAHTPRVHFQALWQQLDSWSLKVRASLARPNLEDHERSQEFVDDVMSEIARDSSQEEAQSYARAGRFDFSWTGLARYWRKQEQSA